MTLIKYDVFTARVHVRDHPVLMEKKHAGIPTWSVLDTLSALLTYIPWTTNHTHIECILYWHTVSKS